MKKYLLFILSVFLLFSCDISEIKEEREGYHQEEVTGKQRIRVVGSYRDIYMYEIDGHLYATCYRGGLTHLESCTCKKHEEIREK